MKNWVNIGEIPYDWYEIHCEIGSDNQLTVHLEGLKTEKHRYSIHFGKVLLYNVIDEGWDLNGIDEGWGITTSNTKSNEKRAPSMSEAILSEQLNSRLSHYYKERVPSSFHHYTILGINFTVNVLAEEIPVISDNSVDTLSGFE